MHGLSRLVAWCELVLQLSLCSGAPARHHVFTLAHLWPCNLFEKCWKSAQYWGEMKIIGFEHIVVANRLCNRGHVESPNAPPPPPQFNDKLKTKKYVCAPICGVGSWSSSAIRVAPKSARKIASLGKKCLDFRYHWIGGEGGARWRFGMATVVTSQFTNGGNVTYPCCFVIFANGGRRRLQAPAHCCGAVAWGRRRATASAKCGSGWSGRARIFFVWFGISTVALAQCHWSALWFCDIVRVLLSFKKAEDRNSRTFVFHLRFAIREGGENEANSARRAENKFTFLHWKCSGNFLAFTL